MPVFLSKTEWRYVQGDTDTISPDHQIKLKNSIRRKMREIKHDFKMLAEHEEFKAGIQEVIDYTQKTDVVEAGVIVD